MKTIYKSIALEAALLSVTLALQAEIQSEGETVTADVQASSLDRLKVTLVSPNVSGARDLVASGNATIEGNEIAVNLENLAFGTHRLIISARFGTQIRTLYALDISVPQAELPNETQEYEDAAIVVSTYGDGGGGGGDDVGLVVRGSVSGADLEICDEAGNVLLRLCNGGVETQNLKSELYGKRIINYGDSIAFGENSYRVAGDATTKGYSYAPMLADAIGGLCVNRAVSGYTIAQILSRINDDAALTGYDIVLIEGGTNDMSTSLAVGTVDMTNNAEPSSSPSTYAQYVERIMWVAKSRFVGGFVYWLLPHRMATRTLSAQEAYWSVVKQAAAKWGVCVIDIYGNSCFTASPLSLGAEYTDFNDPLGVTHGGTHPNTEGYKKYYLPIVYDTVFRTSRKVLN